MSSLRHWRTHSTRFPPLGVLASLTALRTRQRSKQPLYNLLSSLRGASLGERQQRGEVLRLEELFDVDDASAPLEFFGLGPPTQEDLDTSGPFGLRRVMRVVAVFTRPVSENPLRSPPPPFRNNVPAVVSETQLEAGLGRSDKCDAESQKDR